MRHLSIRFTNNLRCPIRQSPFFFFLFAAAKMVARIVLLLVGLITAGISFLVLKILEFSFQRSCFPGHLGQGFLLGLDQTACAFLVACHLTLLRDNIQALSFIKNALFVFVQKLLKVRVETSENGPIGSLDTSRGSSLISTSRCQKGALLLEQSVFYSTYTPKLPFSLRYPLSQPKILFFGVSKPK